MLRAAACFPHYQPVIAGAPGIDPDYYRSYMGDSDVRIVFGQTYALLRESEVALVTSGTATLETCLFRVREQGCFGHFRYGDVGNLPFPGTASGLLLYASGKIGQLCI